MPDAFLCAFHTGAPWTSAAIPLTTQCLYFPFDGGSQCHGLAKRSDMRHTAELDRRKLRTPNVMASIFRKSVAKSLQFYWRRTRALTMGAQGIVLDADNRVLLIRHTYRPGWHFPGGGIEKGETAEFTVARELEEEVGVVCAQRPDLFGLYANFKAFPSDHIALFVVRTWTQPTVPLPNREIAEQMFAAPDALPDGAIGAVARRLNEVLSSAERSERW